MAGEASTSATVREWTDLLRRVRFGSSVQGMRGSTVKYVARTLATYADGDGTRVFPGIARVSVDCEVNYQTAKKAVGVLRELGLIEPVKSGTRRGHADEYRLAIPVDLLERLEVLSPGQFDVAVERVRGANRRRGGGTPPDGPASTGDVATRTEPTRAVGRASVRVPQPPAPPVDSAVDSEPVQVAEAPVHHQSAGSGTGGSSTDTGPSTGDGSTAVRVAHSPPTIHYRDTTPTSHLTGDHRTEVAVGGAPPAEDRISVDGCGECERGFVWPRGPDGRVVEGGLPAYCPTCRPDQAEPERLARVIPINRSEAA